MTAIREIFQGTVSADTAELQKVYYEALRSHDYGAIKNIIEKCPAAAHWALGGGQTALHYAVCVGYLEMIQFLLDKGVDPNLKDIHGNTPLMWMGVGELKTATVELMIARGARLDIQDNKGMTVLEVFRKEKGTRLEGVIAALESAEAAEAEWKAAEKKEKAERRTAALDVFTKGLPYGSRAPKLRLKKEFRRGGAA